MISQMSRNIAMNLKSSRKTTFPVSYCEPPSIHKPKSTTLQSAPPAMHLYNPSASKIKVPCQFESTVLHLSTPQNGHNLPTLPYRQRASSF